MPLDHLVAARSKLWPHFDDGTEPDCLILLDSDTDAPAVPLLVEAKLHSSQHKINGRSQLGHYGICHSLHDYMDTYDLGKQPDVRPVLFVTAHETIPSKEIRQARWELQASQADEQACGNATVGVFWASWYHAGKEAIDAWRQWQGHVKQKPWLRVLLDLREDLGSRDLLPRPPFRGIPRPADSLRVSSVAATASGIYSRRYGLPAPSSVVLGGFARRPRYWSPVPAPVEHQLMRPPFRRPRYWSPVPASVEHQLRRSPFQGYIRPPSAWHTHISTGTIYRRQGDEQ
jgi:hypothetical protein